MLAPSEFQMLALSYQIEAMKTVEEIRVDRLEWVKRDRQWNTQQLADAIGKQHAQVSQILTGAKHSKTGKPRTLGSKLAREIELKLGLADGLLDSPVVGAESGSSQAQTLSYPTDTIPYNEPPTLDWRELKLGRIEERFRTQMPDASMDAGRSPIPKGRWLVFDKATKAPDGRRVIVRVNGDKTQIFVRRVKEVDGGWLAKPDDEDFDAFDSRKVKLDIVALLHHIETPDEG